MSIDGSPLSLLKSLKFLKQHHPEACVVVIGNRTRKHTDLSLRWVETADEDGGFISTPSGFWANLKAHIRKCVAQGKRFAVFPFGFSCINRNGHSNIMIYDTLRKTLERFDPLPNEISNCVRRDVDSYLQKEFRRNLGADAVLSYHAPSEIGDFQRRQEDEHKPRLDSDAKFGFCTSWVIFYADWRLSHPMLSRENAIRSAHKLIMGSCDSYTDFIRAYSSQIGAS